MKAKSYLYHALMAVIIVAFTVASSGCKQSKKEEEKAKTEKEAISKEEIKKDIEEVVYPLPSTFEITKTLNEIGASFIISLSNETENADNYVTEEKQALNLGVYSADLSYATTYNMKQYTMSYMDVSKKLIKELGITGAYKPEFVKEVKNNLDQKRKLTKLITNSFYDTYEYMNKNGKEELSLLVVSGSWIEAMYITTHISENTYHNKKIVDLIADQESTLKKLLNILEPYKSRESIKNIIDQLKPIKKVYDNREGKDFTQEQVLTIKEKIGEVRANLVS